jgi:hypothetical protein
MGLPRTQLLELLDISESTARRRQTAHALKCVEIRSDAADRAVVRARRGRLRRSREGARVAAAAAEIIGVWGIDAGNVWAVGTAGAIMRWNGSSWDLQESNTTSDLHAVWASAPNDAWAVGSGGTIVHWNGTEWQPVASGTSTDLLSIWGSSASDIWAVGSVDSGIILRYAPE